MTENLYIHIPFCEQKCHYCSFSSFAGYDDKFIDIYIRSCLQELSFYQAQYKTVYFGGGTPSVLNISQIECICASISKLLPSNYEWTIETNPNSITEEKFHIMKQYGVNRISIGVQSFQNEILHKLGRIHDKNTAQEAILLAQKCGFENISVDFITGIQGQTAAMFENDLQKAHELGIKHISCYSLTIEPDTPFYIQECAGKSAALSDEEMAEFYLFTDSVLTSLGFEHYEISSYSKPGFYSQHNSAVWKYEPYRGIGAGAVSFDGVTRIKNLENPNDYIRAVESGKKVFQFCEQCDEITQKNERIMLSLRSAGLNLDWYQTCADIPAAFINSLITEGLARITASRLRLTASGMLMSNEIIQRFFI